MGSMDAAYQNLDWEHSPIGNEDYWHRGLLESYVITPALTIGLSDYFNLTIAQSIGVRIMNYDEVDEVDVQTSHHRDEGSNTDYNNANGGVLGDLKLLLRYLVLNDGMQGNRLFLGSGLIIPSESRLTKSPFIKDSNGNYDNHRHFAMSEGTYQWIGELQFFRKLTPPIIFWGASSVITIPLKENSEGYLSPLRLDLSLSFLTQKIKLINASLGLYIQYRYSGPEQWDGKIQKNSEGHVFTPGIGLIWATKNKLGLSMNMLFPQLIANSNLSAIESDVTNHLTAYQITLGLRKTFDYSIPFLD